MGTNDKAEANRNNLNNSLNRALEAERIRSESGKCLHPECRGNMRSPGTKLTVVLRDDAPLIHCGDSPSYRTVVIELTSEQEQSIMLRRTGSDGGTPIVESVSKLILEPWCSD